MKNIIFVILLSFGGSTMANDLLGVAVVGAVTGSTIAAGNAAYYDRILESELDSWKDEKTNSSSRLFHQCAMNLELKIIGNRRLNAISLVLHNPTESNITVKPDEIAIEFSNDMRRYPDYFHVPDDIHIKSNWRFKGSIPLTDKSVLKNIDALEVHIPIYDDKGLLSCTIKGELQREKEVSSTEYLRSNYMDFVFGYAAGLSDSSSAFSDTANGIQLEWNFYPWINKGISFGLIGRIHNGSNENEIQGKLGSPSSPSILDTSIYFGYIQRWHLSNKHSFTGSLGLTLERIELDYANQSGLFSSTNSVSEAYDEIGGYMQVGYDYLLASTPYGFWIGDYSVGVAYRYQYSSKSTYSSVEFGGGRSALLVYFRMAL